MRTTSLFCIYTKTDWIQLMVFVNWSTIDSEIHSIIPPDKYFITPQLKSVLTTSNFKHWFEKIFIPELQLNRQKYNYSGTCLLLMDNFIYYQQILNIINFDEYNIKVLFIGPQTSDKMHPIDLNIFRKKKSFKTVQLKTKSAIQVKQIGLTN